jgi:DUF1680 family protein
VSRIALSALLVLAGAGPTLGAAPGEAAVRPHAVLGAVGLGEARWAGGFWAERFATCRTATLPALSQVMEGTGRSQFLHNFRIAAGLEKGRHRGAPFNDGEVYKWLEAAAAVYAVSKDRELARQMDEAVRVIALAQRGDGYLHTPVLIRNRNGDGTARPLTHPLDFEMYNLGHLFTAACAHRRATGKSDLLNVAVKAADFLRGAFQSPTPELARLAVCPSHYMGLVELYRITGDARHLRLAEKLVALRDRAEGGSDDNQDRLPFRRQTQAVGHAVRANYLYAGVADLYAETGDPELLGPLRAIWQDAVSRKMYVTGGCGALYDGASPDGARDQKQIARVHQAYGRAYQLPNSTAHNETCAAVANVLWNWRMLQVTGEAKYADVLEVALYNAVLAGVSLDGRRFFYANTLRQLDTMPVPLRWSRTREEWISSFCCPPNVARTVAASSTYAYGRSARGVWVHLYGGSTLDTTLPDGRRVKLRQETGYPWDGRVKITVESAPKGEVSLFLRVPGWAEGAALSVNGKPAAVTPGRYAEVRRAWASGDAVELTLPLRPRLMEAHPLVEEARNQVAVLRGPLVYCLESTDLPRGVGVQAVAFPRGIRFTPRFERGLLGGVTVLEGRAEAATDRPWGDELYRELKPSAARPVDVKLIPYFAWGNRGKSEMTVWVPLGR